jgi:hypothetical protein
MSQLTKNSIRAGTLQTIQQSTARRAQTTPVTPANQPMNVNTPNFVPGRYHSAPAPSNQGPNPSNNPDDGDGSGGGGGDGDGGNDPDDDYSDPGNPFLGPAELDHVPNLAEAITLLAGSLGAPKQSSARTKTREPDTFDGSDSRKLQPFLLQCHLNFRDRPDAFSSGSAKVTYALSYLKGTALDWFEPALLGADLIDEPIWLSDYKEFVSELKVNFGPYDPEGEAETKLENLRMRDGQRITKYFVEFNRLAVRTQWGEAALKNHLYRGLPARIKDKIARNGKPDTLGGLR